MDLAVLLSGNMTVVMIVQVVWGILVKRVPALAPVPNKLIPILNMVVGWLTALVAPAGVAKVAVLLGIWPDTAYAGGVLSSAGNVVGNPLFQSWLGMALTTSHHSLLKNTWQWIKETLLNR